MTETTDAASDPTTPRAVATETCGRCGQVGEHTTAPGLAYAHWVCLACADELERWFIAREERR